MLLCSCDLEAQCHHEAMDRLRSMCCPKPARQPCSAGASSPHEWLCMAQMAEHAVENKMGMGQGAGGGGMGQGAGGAGMGQGAGGTQGEHTKLHLPVATMIPALPSLSAGTRCSAEGVWCIIRSCWHETWSPGHAWSVCNCRLSHSLAHVSQRCGVQRRSSSGQTHCEFLMCWAVGVLSPVCLLSQFA